MTEAEKALFDGLLTDALISLEDEGAAMPDGEDLPSDTDFLRPDPLPTPPHCERKVD